MKIQIQYFFNTLTISSTMDWAFSHEIAKTTIGDLHKIRLNIDFVEPVYFCIVLGVKAPLLLPEPYLRPKVAAIGSKSPLAWPEELVFGMPEAPFEKPLAPG